MSQNGSNSAISRLFFLTPWSYSKEFLRAKTPPRTASADSRGGPYIYMHIAYVHITILHILPILRGAGRPYRPCHINQYLESFKTIFFCSKPLSGYQPLIKPTFIHQTTLRHIPYIRNTGSLPLGRVDTILD